MVNSERTEVKDTAVELPAKTSKSSVSVGLGGALIGSVCCLLPALGLAIGFGGTAGLVQLGLYQPYFLAASVLLVGGWNFYTLQRNLSCCTTASQRRSVYLWSLLSIAIFLSGYLVVNHVLVPWLYEIRAGGMISM